MSVYLSVCLFEKKQRVYKRHIAFSNPPEEQKSKISYQFEKVNILVTNTLDR